MAEYVCTIRTNYFHVKDPDAFRAFMGRVYGTADFISFWQERDLSGRPVFGFGTHGPIGGLRNAEEAKPVMQMTAPMMSLSANCRSMWLKMTP